MSPTELTNVRDALARALSVDAVNQLGRETGQAVRLRTVTPQRLFLAERPFLPAPATFTDCLLLADRGYPSVAIRLAELRVSQPPTIGQDGVVFKVHGGSDYQ